MPSPFWYLICFDNNKNARKQNSSEKHRRPGRIQDGSMVNTLVHHSGSVHTLLGVISDTLIGHFSMVLCVFVPTYMYSTNQRLEACCHLFQAWGANKAPAHITCKGSFWDSASCGSGSVGFSSCSCFNEVLYSILLSCWSDSAQGAIHPTLIELIEMYVLREARC